MSLLKKIEKARADFIRAEAKFNSNTGHDVKSKRCDEIAFHRACGAVDRLYAETEFTVQEAAEMQRLIRVSEKGDIDLSVVNPAFQASLDVLIAAARAA